MNKNEQVKAIFQHLQNFARIRKNDIVNIKEIKSNIYNIDSFPMNNQYITYFENIDDILDNNEIFIRVRFPNIPELQPPPEDMSLFIKNDWKSSKIENLELESSISIGEPKVDSHGHIYYEQIKLEDHENYREFLKWIAIREAWLPKDREAKEALRLYRLLFDLREATKSYNDTHDLLLGTYLFKSHKELKNVNHPLVLKNVIIDYDLETRVIEVRTNVDNESYLNIGLFDKISGLNNGDLGPINTLFNSQSPHPLDKELDFEINKLINSLTPHNHFCSESPVSSDTLISVVDEKYLFLRPKIDRTEQYLENVIEEVEEGNIPDHIYNIAGINSGKSMMNEYEIDPVEQLANVGGESSDILLAKLANEEQLEIIKRLDQGHDGVLVQGPPGTGKTHTIANIMGHFLSEGKSILVTSHTRKALAVLKEKLPEPLQGLAVSLVDDNNRDMEQSVNIISERIGSNNSLELSRKIEENTRERVTLIDELSSLRKQIISLKISATESVVINGKGYSLEELADYLYKNESDLNFIPGTVKKGYDLPLTYEEFDTLYRTNSVITKEEETAITLGVINPVQIIDPIDLECFINNKKAINDLISKYNLAYKYIYDDAKHVIRNKNTNDSVFNINNKDNFLEISKILDNVVDEDWGLSCIVAGARGGNYRLIWEDLINLIESTYAKQNDSVHLLFSNSVTYNEENYDEILSSLREFEEAKNAGGLSFTFKKIFNADYKNLISSVLVNGTSLMEADNASIAREYFELESMKDKLFSLWDKLTGNVNKLEDVEQLHNLVPKIEYYLNFNDVIDRLKDLFISNEIKIRDFHDYSLYLTTEDYMKHVVEDISSSKKDLLLILERLLENKMFQKSINESLKSLMTENSSVINTNLMTSLKQLDVESYRLNYEHALRIYDKSNAASRRQSLLNKLREYAPDWANAISSRTGIHGEDVVPEYLNEAWTYKQYALIIDDALSTNYNELLSQANVKSRQLREKTADLAADKAWLHLLNSVGDNIGVKQSLASWKQVMKKIGKGTGKRVASQRREAQTYMKTSQQAIPAWIMPIDQVINTMNPQDNHFDIVIVDEASQSDITALGVLFLGSKVIVVGDDKQVSPMSIGIGEQSVENSIETYLVPAELTNAKRYTHTTSIYDLAEASYDSLMLKEHFRCVPEIIAFSNNDSYDGRIKPLRDSSTAKVFPPVISYRVENGVREGREKKNVAEARTIAAIIRSCVNQEEYQELTFGVITMLSSTSQANLIRSEIQKHLSFDEVEKHQILVGNASEFQGDERDVILLSLIDSNEGEGVARLVSEGREDSVKKRYNVATSRAKDQLWVIHSFDYKNDLQENDYRRKLIEFAENYQNYDTAHQIDSKSDSPFESEVTKALIARGFNVEQQYEVGPYSLDIVIRYKDEKIAIECDGERYHSTQEQVTNDLKRQTVLERIGWRFIRLRGSEYYLNPVAAIDQLVNNLHDQDIFEETKSANGNNTVTNTVFKLILNNVNELLDTNNNYVESIYTRSEVIEKPIKTEKTNVQRSIASKLDKIQKNKSNHVDEEVHGIKTSIDTEKNNKTDDNSQRDDTVTGNNLMLEQVVELVDVDQEEELDFVPPSLLSTEEKNIEKAEPIFIDKGYIQKNENIKIKTTKVSQINDGPSPEGSLKKKHTVGAPAEEKQIEKNYGKDLSTIMTPDVLEVYSFNGLSIIRHIGVIVGEDYNVQVNYAQWGFKKPNYDISPWSDDMSSRKPGIYLSSGELENLYNLITDELNLKEPRLIHSQRLGFLNADAKKRLSLNYQSRKGKSIYSIVLWSKAGDTTSVEIFFDRNQLEDLHNILEGELLDDVEMLESIEIIEPINKVEDIPNNIKEKPLEFDDSEIDPFLASKRAQEIKREESKRELSKEEIIEQTTIRLQKSNYEIVEEFGALKSDSKWKTRVNLISWYGNLPKYDIRAWSDNGEFGGKGITLTKDELHKLHSLIVKELKQNEKL